ncbi:hypothetical protein BaRGS_00033832 [Batillaria attramentaria]|uniref:PiggyBac transposable element-derived protein domain-containing protein n=1 Tax=Batillaria attramentaria TaxID=370345 RepID=A0ABD0JJN8_9CAEN
MVTWRGRLSFRMFISSKPTHYGIKLYCMCDSETGYICKLQVYTGASAEGREKDHGPNIIKRLSLDFLGRGHVIYMDSHFSSPDLFEHLRKRHFGSGNGLVR